MRKLEIICLLIFIMLAACRENIDEITVTTTQYVPEHLEQWQQPMESVIGSVKGFVTDENGNPVPDAEVQLGSATTITDILGHFFFRDISLNKKGTLVQVEKEGYFPGSRRFFAIENVENNLTIQLIPKTNYQYFSASSGRDIELNGGATITFDPNSIQYEDGTPYSGTVVVAAYWLNPENVNTLDQMPGNLQGVNFQSEEVVLQTAGMMAVELFTLEGEPLNILKGETATLSMPVSPDMIGTLPSQVPTWSYNEEHGMWVEEGIATLQGNAYVGEVEHFSWWNCDFQGESVNLSATFVSTEGDPLVGYRVVVRQQPPSNLFCAAGRTSDQGIISGPIPKNMELIIEFYGPCETPIYTQTIPASSTDIDLGLIEVEINAILVSGELLNCDGNPVQNGAVAFEIDGINFYEYIESNPFSFTAYYCETVNSITVKGYDFDAFKASIPETMSDVSGDVDFGQIQVCDQAIEDFITLDINGTERVYSPATIIKTTTDGFKIQYSHSGGPDTTNFVNFEIIGYGTTPGNYDGSAGNLVRVIWDGPLSFGMSQESMEQFEITEFGDVGEPVIGTFSGMVTNTGVSPPEEIEITGMFNIRLQ